LFSFEENAEERCEAAVMKSLSLNPRSVDARQTLASLRISQCRKEDACSVLHELFPSIAVALAEYRSRNIVDEMQGKPMDSAHADGNHIVVSLLDSWLLISTSYLVIFSSFAIVRDSNQFSEASYGMQRSSKSTVL
jgi:hypothetical protein